MNFVISQVLGIIALILVSVGYFFKNKKKFLVIQAFANFFCAMAFMVVGAKAAGIVTLISIIRCVYVYFCEKHKFRYTYHFLPVFVLVYGITTVLFWSTPYDYMPFITSSLITICFAIKNLQVMRYLLITPNILIVIYNILVMTYTSAIIGIIENIVIIVAIFKYRFENKKSYKQFLENKFK